MRRLTLLVAGGRALAVPCRDSCPGGWWTPRGSDQLRRRWTSPPTAAPAATGPTPPRACYLLKEKRSGLVPDLPRHQWHRRDDRRRVRASSTPRPGPRGVDRGSPSAPCAPAGSSRPASPPATRPDRVPGQPRASRSSSPRSPSGPLGRHVRPPSRSWTGEVVTGTGIAWGNGPDSATAYAGPSVKMDCTSCHNPHGNGQYRILKDAPQTRGRRRHRIRSCRPPRRPQSPTRRSRRPVTRATTPSSRRTAGPARSSRARSTVLDPARHGGRLLPPEGPVERERAARRTTRRTACPRPSRPRSRRGASPATRATSARAGTRRRPTRSTSTGTPPPTRLGTASRATWRTVPTP